MTDNTEQQFSIAEIDKLYRNGKLPRAGMQFLKQMVAPRNVWGQWADKLSLVVGVVLVLAGVIFFFAFNWKDMAGWQKLGLINLGLVACVSAAVWHGLGQVVVGQALAIAASVFVGVFMAVFGQIYQTGADAYQLFMMWSILILPWVILSKSLAHWTLWLVVLLTFVSAFWLQAISSGFEILTLLAAIGLVSFAAQSYLASKRPDSWLDHSWFSWLWVIYTFAITAYLCGLLVFKMRYGLYVGRDPFLGQYQYLAGYFGLVLHAIGYYLTFRYFKNLVSAQIWTLITAILVSAVFLILFAEALFDNGEVGFLLGGLIAAAAVTGVFWGGIRFLSAHQFDRHQGKGGANA